MSPKLRIQLSSNKVYHPGSTVTGSLLLDVDEAKSYKQILVQLSGRSYVHWRESSGQSSRNCISLEPYFDSVAPLWDSRQSPDGKLPPGQYNWPFSFVIPPSVPSSFEGKFGNIRYMLVGRIVTGALKYNHDVMALIPVQQLVQITDPRLLQPVRTEVQKTVGFLFSTSQPIIMSVAVPKTGFFIGESFQLHISLENGSKRRVSLTATLKEYVTFAASGSSRKISRSLYAIRTNRVERQQTEHLDKTIMVPLTDVDIVHKSSCRNIRVIYCIKVTCHIPRAFNLSTTIPLELANCR
ncbi:Arrestin domain-containing protein 4 [Geodia barretti]|uniref:Arrestin domain-containing protein 4 n=1 Tax=Geodia barretti TaxID=519541 RepID=A0AA35R5H4_GEOBA|nr:Arrestin domain-containing protein 4 [Geodia barretti]